jgi:hypothetical protein
VVVPSRRARRWPLMIAFSPNRASLICPRITNRLQRINAR